MDTIIIRKATLEDLDILLRFEQGVIAAERPSDNTLQDGLIHYYDLKEMITGRNIELVIAELNQCIVGCGYARIDNSKPFYRHKKHSYFGFMYVDPDHRGKGVNKKIIEALQQWSISQNVTEMRLEVYNDNIPAIKAYEKVGFTKYIIEMRMDLNKE